MQLTKNIIFLFVIYLALAGIAYVLIELFNIGLPFKETAILLTGSLVIALIVLLVFMSGIRKPEKNSILMTLSAVGLKFLLFLAMLGIYALLSTNLGWDFIITFFLIYISYTVYLLITFVQILKTKRSKA